MKPTGLEAFLGHCDRELWQREGKRIQAWYTWCALSRRLGKSWLALMCHVDGGTTGLRNGHGGGEARCLQALRDASRGLFFNGEDAGTVCEEKSAPVCPCVGGLLGG